MSEIEEDDRKKYGGEKNLSRSALVVVIDDFTMGRTESMRHVRRPHVSKVPCAYINVMTCQSAFCLNNCHRAQHTKVLLLLPFFFF